MAIIDELKGVQAEKRLEIIDKLGIFELRGLAREVGVRAPTTKKRAELIDLIMESFSQEFIVPHRQLRMQGRPVKTLNNLEQLITSVAGGEVVGMSTASKIKPYEEVVSFAQPVPVFSLEIAEEKDNFDGVLRVSGKVACFNDRRTDRKVFVPQDMVKKFRLGHGDYLKVEGVKINMSNQFVATEIFEVNGKEPAQANKKIKEFEGIISHEVMPYGDNSLQCGGRNLICIKGSIYEDSRFGTFAENLKKNGYTLVILSLNTMIEDMITFKNIPDAILLSTEYGKEIQMGLDRVVDTISLVERLASTGHKVVLFVNDLMQVIKSLDLCFSTNKGLYGHIVDGVVVVKKLITLACAHSDGSEATLVMTYHERDAQDEFLQEEVLRVCKIFE